MALRISVALTIITNPIVVSLIIEHSFLKIKYQQLTLTEPKFNRIKTNNYSSIPLIPLFTKYNGKLELYTK